MTMMRTWKTAWLFPGQGSQARGMGGEDLFNRYPDLVAEADAVLGYSIRELCLHDPRSELSRTRFAQPALYVVNALSHRAMMEAGPPPDCYAGHSLGEYNALLAAGCFDFAAGLRLVRLRGQLMGQADGGAMAAVIGLDADQLRFRLEKAGVADKVDIANINSADQIVISGDKPAIHRFADQAGQQRFARVVPLAVSAAFHSRFMEAAAATFADALGAVALAAPRFPVVANVTGEFYPPGEVGAILSRQIGSPVLWRQSMMTLRRAGVGAAEQVGPGNILIGFWRAALAEECPPPSSPSAAPAASPPGGGHAARHPAGSTARLGEAFCRRHGLSQAYVAGSMYRGISSPRLVVAMARAGLLAFFGAGGMSLPQVEASLDAIQDALPPEAPFGVNVLASPQRPELERAIVDLCLRRGVRYAEVSGFTHVAPDVVAYRFRGARMENGRAVAPHTVFAKVSRLEVAEAFLRPPEEKILRSLQEQGRLSGSEADAARRLPVASELCMEADSGGHTDGAVQLALLPAAKMVRDTVQAAMRPDQRTGLGAAGGLGTPEAIAACFVLGAEFVLCGSIHQCTPEAGTSTAVKDLLGQIGLHDTGYAPAGDLFTTGARVQVVRRATLFSARANHLYDVYRTYGGLNELPRGVCETVERYLGTPWPLVWEKCTERLRDTRPEELERLRNNGKAKMARVFKTYFTRTIESALAGDVGDRVNWQIQCGPAMGAFNAFARSAGMEAWQTRNIERIAHELMGRADHFHKRFVG